MEWIVVIHWKLRRGLGPDFEGRVSEICLDDLPEETTWQEAQEIAVSEFKSERYRRGTRKNEFYITDVHSA